jgi:signal transduction histidine kinase
MSSVPPAASPAIEDYLGHLFTVAEKQDKLSGIREILRAIAESLDSEGCILWEVMPGGAPLEERKLFVLAEYFQGDWPAGWQHLAMSSRTGTAILREEPQFLNDLAPIQQELPAAARAYMEDRNVRAVCAVPVNLRGGITAAINLYRSRAEPFKQKDIERLEQVAARIPYLYNSLVNQVGLELLESVTRLIHSASPLPEGLSDQATRARLHDTLSRVVELVAATFNSLECAIYLEDPSTPLVSCRLEATKWPWVGFRQPQLYDKGHGLTGYCVDRQIPVRIFDLGRYGEDRAFIESQYPGVQWSDPIDLKKAAREFLRPVGELPPLSFMCAPIVGEGRSLGALRCCVTQTGPHYFDDRQVRFLGMVADRIGQLWANHLRLQRAARENSRWKTLVEGVSRLNALVHGELKKREPSEQRIFEYALRIAADVNLPAEALSVRLYDEKTRELYFAVTRGSRWERGSSKEIEARKKRRYPVDGPSSGAHVFRTGDLLSEPDAQQSAFKRELFSDVKTLITAPMSSSEKIFGVLDVRAFEQGDVPRHAEIFTELLARQLGMCHFLALEIQELNRVQTELRTSLSVQQRVYEDFQHQMKTPVITAHQMAQAAVGNFRSGRLATDELRALRGVCRKAERVAANMRLFAALAKAEAIKVNWKVLPYKQILETLSESAEDHAVMVPPERELRFTTDCESLRVLETTPVYTDPALMEQALGNLLDNAGKYSYPRTAVMTKGGVTRRNDVGCFYIAVVNRGLEISLAERDMLTDRGYRGTKASLSTGEGAGIGLWIVDRIMRAHGGWLEISPTNDRGFNEFRLLFRLGIPKALQ